MEYALFWEEELTNFDSSDFTTKLWFYESKDGTKVPLHISYRSNVEVNEQTPVLLYGYGGFDIAILPSFSQKLSCLDESRWCGGSSQLAWWF